MIESILVANRGEIACRIFRTCREAGIATVAVHADPDAGALHVRSADTAVRLPGTTAAETYLRGDLVIRAALAGGADAVHPGYGFLSENAGFARAVTDAGLVWIGPPAEAIEAMASKTRAKQIMAAAGVPLLAPLDPAALAPSGLPVLIKAAAGGGGRGMRVVRDLAVLEEELRSARAEAMAAFGDGEVFVEPYVEGARHVEVQILADTHGTVWTLGTRDCSLQRRHQKVVEEAPAPDLPEAVRAALTSAAEAAARAIGYVGAGTVEFLLPGDGRGPYFLEMNTRLQVEHPVTEAVYGVDLVALQIRVAEGEALGAAAPEPYGHAVEARLTAEGGMDQPVRRLRTGGSVRLDTGYTDGDTVPPHYDPLLAKAIAWAPTRREAIRKLAHALEHAAVHGPHTNRDLLVRTLRHPEFMAGAPDTGFLERHFAELTRPRDARFAALAAALAVPHAPGAWRNVPSQPQVKRYRSEPDGAEYEIRYRRTRDGLVPEGFPGVRVVSAAPDRVALEAGGVTHTFEVTAYDARVHVDTYTLTALPRFPDPAARAAEPGSLLAPMPGTVVRVADGIAVGEPVKAGQPLLWLEAMKMEHRVTAPVDGTLTALHATPGRQVETGETLAVVTRTTETEATP
ncbi:acetyl/propionyl/methylcrotonyl-CoA carboxylase subunit alpha [Streptomyces hesseae]|uniref:Biotin carboxylase N-terminal domain-containing protein n=1 Tax=Streptomyces hesseae TaxID=3075519 RepID=A0ABU2SP34_9ACTN|nr:biotin carboxylase N-terminal domain-containing protein [Streptomyces sp. DSM 40473]MDT0450737.1 biotin carboxylase N-terminal domain-containing protein [Streptomyces sp. DSM 40473]